MTTNRVRSIRLKEIFDVSKLPPMWDQSQDNVIVKPTSIEYLSVDTFFVKTMRGYPVKCVGRIQNIALYQQFSFYKMQLEARLGRGKPSDVCSTARKMRI